MLYRHPPLLIALIALTKRRLACALSKYSNKAHARRGFDEAVKALPKAKQKDSRSYLALTMIQAIYREEKQLKELPPQERQNRRQLSVRPLIKAYFIWVRENLPKVPQKSKTWEVFSYSLNQKKYLKVFLDDGEVPMDNNATEQSIREFLHREKELGHDRHGCRCEIRRNHLQHSRNSKSKQSEAVGLL